jgi:iron complex outermembrane receptor protein
MTNRPLGRSLAAIAALASSAAAAQVVSANNLADLSLEQLSTIEVTSVSGRAESLHDAAASIFVITGEDIRRSAATSLPEALRLAPNLQVAQSSAGNYAISARGFNNEIANKLLVLIDGRSVYSSLFSGVFWDANDVMLEDVERIEVISGPGGTLWGANAVNGIINVIMRSAEDSHGVLLSTTRSSRGGREAARWGAAIGESGHARVYALVTDRRATRLESGEDRPDGSRHTQLGARADWERGADQLTLQGDVYQGGKDPANNLAAKLHGGNLLARWSSRFRDGSPYKLQAYYDNASRHDALVLRNKASSVDLQFSHEPQMPAGHALLWGAGYRRGSDDNEPSPLVLFQPNERRLTWANVFAQDQIRFGERWRVTLGAKAERNSYTGLEFLPNVRLSYDHSPTNLTWASLSRTVRAPSRIDREFYFPGAAPFLIAGGANFQSEVANVAEIGHRGQLNPDFTYSVTAYRQAYKGLRAGIPGVFPAVVSNQIDGTSTGVEAWAQWQPRRDWRLSAGLFTLRKRLAFSSGFSDATSIPNLGNDPRHQWQLRSSLDVGARNQLDVIVRHVGALPTPAVPAYTAVDMHWDWRVTPSFSVGLLAQNLFDRRHVEFNEAAGASQIERRVFLRLAWRL